MDIPIMKTIHVTDNKTIHIFETEYQGTKCYCIEHTPTGAKTIIDYDNNLVQTIIRKMDRVGALVVCRKQGRVVFKFHANKKNVREKSISLKTYLYMKYNNTSIKDVRKAKINLLDDSACKYDVLDFRKQNLFHAGGYREENIHIVERPNTPNEKYIVVTHNGKFAIQDYSSELEEMMCRRTLCSVGYNKQLKRHNVVVHSAAGATNYKIFNLGRFVVLYNTYFERYKNTNEGIRKFLRKLPTISKKLEKENDCGHIYSNTWNNSANNIMLMDGKTNKAMRTLITHFVGNYKSFAVVYREAGTENILVEIVNAGKSFYYICHSAEDYLDLQKAFVKSPLVDNLRISIIGKNEVKTYDTPQQAYEKYEPVEEKASIEMFWKWCDERDRLINLYKEYPEQFRHWISCVGQQGNLVALVQNVLPMFLAPFTEC